MARKDGPGLWWQLLEFMGMTWPGQKQRAERTLGPACPACGNPSERSGAGWRCPDHPEVAILTTPAE